MKSKLVGTLLLYLRLTVSFAPVLAQSNSSKTEIPQHPAVGQWTGAIMLPTLELEIHVSLEKSDEWEGAIDIPVQNLRGFNLGNIKVNDQNISFNMPNIPGDPTFNGKIHDGTIRGDFKQAGETFQFKLHPSSKNADRETGQLKGIPGEGFDDVWKGSLHIQLFELRLVFHLTQDNEVVKGTMDSIDQNANDIPISNGTANGKDLTLKLKSVGAVFEGTLNENGSEIEGTWSQGGQRFPLTIYRIGEAPTLNRPQEPKKPYPYNEEEVTFQNTHAGIQLAGTLTFPKTKGPHPAVVLVSGSGPQDRDEAIMGHKPFLVLADHLTRQGIAVLRFDDRGVGDSEGDFSKALTTDFAQDAHAAVTYLQTRKELHPKRIGIAGHSEGGLIAPMVAADTRDVAFIVLLAGVGVPMQDLLVQQSVDLMRVMGATPAMLENQKKTQRRIFELVLEETELPDLKKRIRALMMESFKDITPEQRKAMGITESHFESQLSMVTSPWFRHLLTIDPRPTLEKVTMPVLAINGRKDLQVACDANLEAIEAAVRKGGNNRVTTKAFDDLNHLFQTSKTGAITEYGRIEETFNEEAMKEVSVWIRNIYQMD